MFPKRRLPDYQILTTVLAILVFGVSMVFSASYYEAGEDYGDPYYFLKRQLVWALIGLAIMLFFANLDYWKLGRLVRPMMILTVVLMVLVIIPGIGEVSHGSRRWLGLGPLNFQPSEAAKLALVIFLAQYFSGDKGLQRRFVRGVLPVLGLLALLGGLVMLQPDLGTAIVIAGTGFVMFFVSGVPLSHLAGLVAAGLPAVVLLIFSEDYRRRRFLAFLDPWKDPLGSGYHIIQGLYALGSGGLFGVGYTQSRQKYFYLPERHTDFIFAIIGEEMGFLGAMVVVLLFAVFAWRGYRVALTAPDSFSSYLAAGITSMILLQALINIGVTTSTLPITGITLPFLSFGGSSLVFSLAGIGILLNVSRFCRE